MIDSIRRIKVKLDEWAFLPDRAHDTDAGADIRTPCDAFVPAHGSTTIRTGVHIELPPNCAGILMSKSSLNVWHDIIGTGLIDEGYDGEILVKLYNLGGTDYEFERGDKIINLVIAEVPYPDFVLSDEIQGGERGNAGFGSTGR